MHELTIKLDTVDKVKKFVNLVSRYDGNLDLVSDRYRVDAKSIMGIFSLDLSAPLKLVIDSESELEEINSDLAQFTV